MYILLLLNVVIFAIECQYSIDIYIESQCPDTISLLKKMKPILQYEQIFELFQFNFIPFGKGSEKLVQNKGFQFTCQHAALECYGNLIDSCVLEHLNQTKSLSYLNCIHQKRYSNEQMIHNNLQLCLADYECLYERTLKCLQSKYGNYLQHKAAKLTLAQYLTEIPWININNQHSKEFDKSFRMNPIKAICEIIDCIKYNITNN